MNDDLVFLLFLLGVLVAMVITVWLLLRSNRSSRRHDWSGPYVPSDYHASSSWFFSDGSSSSDSSSSSSSSWSWGSGGSDSGGSDFGGGESGGGGAGSSW